MQYLERFIHTCDMITHGRLLLGVAASRRQPALDACVAFVRHITRDVAEANQELEDFFGVSHSKGVSAVPSKFTSSITDSSTGGHYATPPSQAPGTLGTPFHTDALFTGSSRSGFAPALQGASEATTTAYQGADTAYGTQAASPCQQPLGANRQLTHIDASGSAAMVDVSQKAVTVREAQASCVVSLGDAYELVASNSLAKGDVLKVAQLAGICGAKATASLIPLCHNIPISKVDVQLHLDPPSRSVLVRALARTDGKTGVEMEALTAASVAALTVYDMCKAAAKDMVVGQLQLDYKSGGRSGTYLRVGLRRADLLPSAKPPL